MRLRAVVLGAGFGGLEVPLSSFSSGRAIVGVTAAPFKCPPAPSEAAVLLRAAGLAGSECKP